MSAQLADDIAVRLISAITFQHEDAETCTCEDSEEMCWYRLTAEQRADARIGTLTAVLADELQGVINERVHAKLRAVLDALEAPVTVVEVEREWSNGQPFTVADVINAILRARVRAAREALGITQEGG